MWTHFSTSLTRSSKSSVSNLTSTSPGFTSVPLSITHRIGILRATDLAFDFYILGAFQNTLFGYRDEQFAARDDVCQSRTDSLRPCEVRNQEGGWNQNGDHSDRKQTAFPPSACREIRSIDVAVVAALAEGLAPPATRQSSCSASGSAGGSDAVTDLPASGFRGSVSLSGFSTSDCASST